ncbi:trypsin-like serine peptidase [Nitrincola alkalilacustris]|uniref:trypsin-like serine peptidase n=1 Tax=Nitrincola alkalilacustris TaxID=1571224 RepID=UPI00124F3C86|nr:serine protease [Nitrincola alkalilacustris]
MGRLNQLLIPAVFASLILPAFADETEISAPFIPHNQDSLIPTDQRVTKSLTFAPPSARIMLELTPSQHTDDLETNRSFKAEELYGESDRGMALKVGDGFELAQQPDYLLGDLNWQAEGDNFRATMDISLSEYSMAFRLGFDPLGIPDNLTFYLHSPNHPQFHYGPFTADSVQEQMAQFEEDAVFWSPVIEGGIARVELYTDSPLSLTSADLGIRSVSVLHDSIFTKGLKRQEDAGSSGSCNVNIACDTSSLPIADTTAKYLFTSTRGVTGLCTGALLNDTIGSQEPWFITADHCVRSHYEIGNMQLYWFFRSRTCGSSLPGTEVQTTTGGGTRLYNSYMQDTTLMRLNQMPPTTARAGWRTTPVAADTPVRGIHHPKGDYQKISKGNIIAASDWPLGMRSDTHWQVLWNSGAVEPGSSGSGLFNNNNELVGVLTGAVPYCENVQYPAYYGRFDKMYPELKRWLDPSPLLADSTIRVSGKVTTQLQLPAPVCGLMLINGQHMFTCNGAGEYELNVPTDQNGELSILFFADGFAPYSQTIKATTNLIKQNVLLVSEQRPSPSVLVDSLTVAEDNQVMLTGSLRGTQNVPVCGLVLANGEHDFTCDGQGRFELTAPLSADGTVSVFGFVDGMSPFQTTLTPQ